MSSPSINDEADSEIPSTEVPTTESDLKTSSTIATGSTGDTTSGDASGSASTSESSSSVKKSSSATDGSPDSSPTGTSDTKDGDGGGGQEEEAAAEEAAAEEPPPPPPPPPPKPKKKASPALPPPTDAGETNVAGDVSMMYEQKFKVILRERRKKADAEAAGKNRNKPTVDEMNSYYKAWVTADFEKRKALPQSHEAAKKRRQDAIRQKKAQEAFCTWLSYKKQQIKMERRRCRLQRKERRQLVKKRSRAASERAYECWLAEKRRQHSAQSRPAGHYPPVVHTRDMSLLYAKSFKAAMAAPPSGGPRCASASGRLQRGDEFHNVEDVYCPEHKTEYRLETKRMASGNCYRLTSVRKLD